jgi:microcystin-dependent protein
MSEPFIGQIQLVGFNFAPRGWAFCNGQLLPISQNTALFSLLGTTYGGDGETTFALPDLRGRVPVHSGSSSGPGLSPRPLGQRSGQETVTLNTTQIPAHAHTFSAPVSSDSGETDTPEGGVPAVASEDIYAESTDSVGLASTTGNTGGGQGHNNMQPYLVVNFCIALTGIFPSQN